MKSYLMLLLLPVLLLVGGCDSTDSTEGGTYKYTAFDDEDDVLVSGLLRLEYEDTGDAQYPIRITGAWDLKQIKEAAHVGPQVGKGGLQGSINADGDVWINLNPDWNDNNITLHGRFADKGFSDVEGTWVYSTFAGGINSGRFGAENR